MARRPGIPVATTCQQTGKADDHGDYYLEGTGELEKAASTCQELLESYSGEPYSCVVFAASRQHEKAAEITPQGMRLSPDREDVYANLANYPLGLTALRRARQIIHEAQAQK